MEFLVLGLNHRTAPLEIREQLAVTKAQLPEALTAMGSYLSQGVILSTCNRSEVYTLGPEGQLEEGLHLFLGDYFRISPKEAGHYLYAHRHEACVRHLFRVASSLDSMILGEGQILRQVRDSFEASVQAKTAHGPMSRLFHQALRIGKRVRRETGISRNALSVSRACVELARRSLGDLSRLTVMVLGTGDAGKLAATALRDAGVNRVIVTNRTFHRAEEIAQDLEGEAIPWEQMPQVVKAVDIVISSTGSPGYVLSAEAVREAMSDREGKPLFLIDIAVPRDIEPEAGRLGNVFLYDVDDLQGVSDTNRLEREREAQRAEEMVNQEVGQFLEWYRTLDVLPTIASLRKRAEEIREGELGKLLKRLDHKLTDEDMESLEAMTRAIVNKLLHDPTTYLKEERDPSKVRLLRELFNLDPQLGGIRPPGNGIDESGQRGEEE